MSKRLTQKDFIRRAREAHGDKYDYSEAVYIDTKTPVIIICPEHGEFKQRAGKHMTGQGCPKCSNAKLEETNLKRYGVRRPLQSKEIHDKAKQTNMDTYGVSNPAMSQQVKDKMKETCKLRYGVDYAVQAEAVKQQKEQTLQEKYGGNSPFSSSEIQKKAKDTIRERYGVDNVSHNAEIHARMEQTCIERYGSRSPLSNADVQKKKLETMQEKYGGNSPFVSQEIRDKSVSANMIKYGAANPMQAAHIQQKVSDAKRQNNTFCTSEPEDIMYDCLCDIFGKDDITRQFTSDVYPFSCDFYVKSRDMYIELNASWTHGRHWFGRDSEDDCDILALWQEKAAESDYYKNAVHVWSEKDIQKRECAGQNKLNYVVFWDNELRDFELWSAMGCPDGQDWKREYSWIPERESIKAHCPDKLTGTNKNLSMTAKAYQCDVFYKREIKLWQDNSDYRGLPLQVWLYHNRLKYKKKLPYKLSDSELLSGFTVSGIIKGYTAFDISLMDKAISKYNIKSVYDPCAGWGERLLYCYYNNIKYLGVDINEKLKSGYQNMIKDFDIKNQSIVFADSAEYQPELQADAVITCPPYGSIEKYSNKGAENLSESEFLNWWERVIGNCRNVDYFCFQINQKWHDKMLNVILEHGFEFLEEFKFDKNQSSHFTRKNGINIKKEFETIIVTRKTLS